LAIRARDVVAKSAWQEELIPCLSRVAPPLEGSVKKLGKIIVVFSSKGGVGKTTIAVNLAMALGERAHSPLVLLDLDLAFGDVAPMIGQVPQVTIHDLLNTAIDQPTIKRAVTEVGSNVSVLPAPVRPEQAEDIHAEHLVRILEVLRESFTYIVIDMAPGYGELNVTALDMSDIILTVCTPDVVTLRTVGQALQLFREGFRYPADKVRLVLNRSGSRTGVNVQDIEAILNNQVVYELPSDGSLPVRSANEGAPLVAKYPNSNLTKAILAMADALIKEDFGNRRGKRGPGKRWGILPSLRR
jgi:pilus assembly protein CpaE